MSRAAYTETICSISADGTLKAAGDIRVTVLKLSDLSQATVWKDRTSSAPANKIDAPFLTDATGLVQIYADPDIYKIEFHDTQSSPRMADWYVIWDAVPGDINPVDLGFQVGDLKMSSIESDHGRWLRFDGREMTQAEIESALSLAAGEGSAIYTYLGAGASSKYGAAAAGKVKLPDCRRKTLLGAGTSGDTTPAPMANTTARPLGNTGGEENHTMTPTESAFRSHKHTKGTLLVDAHWHEAGSLYADSHLHGPGSYYAADHNHGPGNLATGWPSQTVNYRAADAARTLLLPTEIHSHTVDTGATSYSGNLGIGGASDYATADVAGGTNTANTNTLSGETGTETAISGGSNASTGHNNMPPYISVGYIFIRV